MSNSLFFTYAFGNTDKGQKREKNEDHYLIDENIGLYVVADGMGGHAAGETASKVAVETIGEIVRHFIPQLNSSSFIASSPVHNPAAQLLSDALRGACHSVHKLSTTVQDFQGMGTTTTALLIHEQHAFVAHVGDSRAYLYRDNRIIQISEDHSLVNEQVKAGIISRQEAEVSRLRNIITRSIGFEDDVEVDMVALPIESGDIFLLCTDGLTTMLPDEEISETIQYTPLSKAVDRLIQLANERGGDDNITAIVVLLSEEKLSGKKPKKSK